MAELKMAYQVRSYSTGTLGRAICNARYHHWVADGSGGDEVGAGELFLSGISACAVNMVENIAHDDQVPLDWMDVSVESYRDPEKLPVTSHSTTTFEFTSRCGEWTTNRGNNWSKLGNAVEPYTVRSPW